jgi:formylglycine-generating enzyme required for sulfatase activity
MNRIALCIAVVATIVCSTRMARAQADACASDLDGDGIVAGADLAIVLGNWGPCKSCDGDVNGDHAVDGIDLAFVLTRWGGSCAPTVDSISPNAGPTNGGTAVRLTGNHLLGTYQVMFGATAATSIAVVSAQEVVAVSPPGEFGACDIEVATIGGSSIVNHGFSYAIVPAWATLIEARPDPSVVLDTEHRNAILATGLAWRVRDIASSSEMVLVPPGTFEMGCSPTTDCCGCDADEFPVHPVTVTSPFYLGRFEVTQSVWQSVMSSNPSYFQAPAFANGPLRPVESMSWNSVQSFLKITGLRLPTEAEWEFACRAGTRTAFHGCSAFPSGSNSSTDLSLVAWYQPSTGTGANYGTHPVGTLLPNGLGLHDMLGNVWEFTADWYSASYFANSPAVDPPGPATGTSIVMRGGSYYEGPPTADLRCSTRAFHEIGAGSDARGFRVARNP